MVVFGNILYGKHEFIKFERTKNLILADQKYVAFSRLRSINPAKLWNSLPIGIKSMVNYPQGLLSMLKHSLTSVSIHDCFNLDCMLHLKVLLSVLLYYMNRSRLLLM